MGNMPSGSKNGRILKLVHPGGIVDIHKKPILAAEVMKKNPRHCVTRPDVFKFPWIVVRPESVLKPGRVFYVVPYHTIRRLLQKQRPKNHGSLLNSHELVSAMELSGNVGGSARFRDRQERDSEDFYVEVTEFQELFREQSQNVTLTRAKLDYKFEDWHEGFVFLGCDEPSLIRTQNLALGWKTFGGNSLIEPSTSSAANNGAGAEVGRPLPTDNRSSGVSNSQEGKMLKSCLKKHNGSKGRKCRVTFVLPGENDEKQRVEVIHELQPE